MGHRVVADPARGGTTIDESMRPTNLAVEQLMAGLVDYAGLFPPAALDMSTAVRNYAAYRTGAHAGMLGRFVVPVARLEEFFAAARESLPRPPEPPWHLAVLGGADLDSDLTRVRMSNARYTSGCAGGAIADVFETRATTVGDIARLRGIANQPVEVYAELSLAPDPGPLLAALSGGPVRAKIRTGGVTPDAIPPARDVATFMVAAARAEVTFKATAGLHHAIRAPHALTYAAQSPVAVMHGFVNVFVAAALARANASLETIVALLSETDASAFRFESSGVRWRDQWVAIDDLRTTRVQFARSFGSCSFTEPVEDLQARGLA